MRWRRAASGLGVAAAALAAAEVGLRAAYHPEELLFVAEEGHPPLPPPRPRGADRAAGLVREDGPYRWTLRLNRQGLREPADLPAAPAPDEVRLLAVGDSWVFGFGATDGQTLTDQLEVLLAGTLAPRVEVINGGEPGAPAVKLPERARGLASSFPDVAGLVLGQPHNPGRGMATLTVPPPADVWVYRALRHALLPRVSPHPPRMLDGDELARATAAWRALADDARAGRLTGEPIPVWFVLFPQDRESAVEHGFGPEAEWVAAMEGIPTVGHALTQRSCWSYVDPFHPGEAGQRAIAEVLAPVVAGTGAASPWSEEPSCDAVPGVGPGKPGSPPAPTREMPGSG